MLRRLCRYFHSLANFEIYPFIIGVKNNTLIKKTHIFFLYRKCIKKLLTSLDQVGEQNNKNTFPNINIICVAVLSYT